MSDDREILPKTLKPKHYAIKLYDLDYEKWTYHGNVVIDYDVNAETDSIQLNYRRLTVTKASVLMHHTKTESSVPVARISHDDKSEVVTISLSEKIPEGASKVQVTLDYDAKIWDDMAGFYRSMYGEDGKQVLLSTQFESTDARRAFPCADEPNLKATFDVSIVVPEQLTALGNMPIKSSVAVNLSGKSDEKSGKELGEKKYKLVTFETTPIMSTYLLAWAVGDLEYIESFTERSYNGKKIPVRVYTVKGKKEQGQLALASAAKIIDVLSETFDIDYPFAKADLIAISGAFSAGAMENIGLITFRETALLFDPATSDSSYKTRVVYVVAHELAHQWFGNLVTMDWWNELWLNEGFATWVGWYVVDKLHPEMDVFTRFVVEALQGALSLDALRGSHPIEVPVRNGKEIDQIFDHISYLKGASAIRMLATRLTNEVFLKGVSNYLKKHSYGNAKTVDLWNALSEVSGIDVAAAMSNWTGKIGFPVISVEEKGNDVELTQNRFLSTGDVVATENETTWWAPLVIEGENVDEATKNEILSDRKTVIKGLAKTNYKLNKEQTGLYRVAYPSSRLVKLAESASSLSSRDRIGLVADSASIASAGVGSITGFLDFVKTIGQTEDNYFVWQEIFSRLANIRSVWGNYSKEMTDGLNKFTASLVSPLVEKLGWEFAPEDDFLTCQLRSLAISTAGAVGVDSVVAEAKARLNKWASGKDPKAIHPSLRLPIFATVIRNSSGEELKSAYEAVLNELTNPTSVDSRETAASALSRAQDPEYATMTINLIMNGTILAQDIQTPLAQLAQNPVSRGVLWKFFETKWDDFYTKFSSNMVVLDRAMKQALQPYSTKEYYDSISKFFADKDTKGFDRSLNQCLDIIRSKYQWIERDSAAIQEWLTKNGY